MKLLSGISSENLLRSLQKFLQGSLQKFFQRSFQEDSVIPPGVPSEILPKKEKFPFRGFLQVFLQELLQKLIEGLYWKSFRDLFRSSLRRSCRSFVRGKFKITFSDLFGSSFGDSSRCFFKKHIGKNCNLNHIMLPIDELKDKFVEKMYYCGISTHDSVIVRPVLPPNKPQNKYRFCVIKANLTLILHHEHSFFNKSNSVSP